MSDVREKVLEQQKIELKLIYINNVAYCIISTDSYAKLF